MLTVTQIAKKLNTQHERFGAGFYLSNGHRCFRARVRAGVVEVMYWLHGSGDEHWIPLDLSTTKVSDHNGRPIHLELRADQCQMNPVTLEVKKILSVAPGTGEVKSWSSRTVHGQLHIVKKTSSVVRFTIGGEQFLSSTKDFKERASGSVFVA